MKKLILNDLRFHLVEKQLLLPSSWLSRLSNYQLKRLCHEVCFATCDQMGGYHSGGCHQVNNERHRRKATRTHNVFIIVFEGTKEKMTNMTYFISARTKLCNFMLKYKYNPMNYKYRITNCGRERWVGPNYVTKYTDHLRIYPKGFKI